MYTSRLDCCQFKDQEIFLRCLICVAATGRNELVFILMLNTSAGTSDEVGLSDCRHVCDDEESHHEGLDEGDHCP